MKTYAEDDKWGIAYVMWVCRSCNTMVPGVARETHVCARRTR